MRQQLRSLRAIAKLSAFGITLLGVVSLTATANAQAPIRPTVSQFRPLPKLLPHIARPESSRRLSDVSEDIDMGGGGSYGQPPSPQSDLQGSLRDSAETLAGPLGELVSAHRALASAVCYLMDNLALEWWQADPRDRVRFNTPFFDDPQAYAESLLRGTVYYYTLARGKPRDANTVTAVWPTVRTFVIHSNVALTTPATATVFLHLCMGR